MNRTVTSHEDVDQILAFFTKETQGIFGTGLTGIYLTGSLSYNAFNYGSSDIDVTVILERPVTSVELTALRVLHTTLVQCFGKWARRFECSYTPIGMLPGILPPGSRPWYWGGDDILYAEAPYGNEWIINNYLLYHHAIPLAGPEFKQLMEPVDMAEVQKACVRDLFTEWEPKRTDRKWFRDRHYESYFVLNLCRILYTVIRGDAGSKQTAAAWVQGNFPEPWPGLVAAAARLEHGGASYLQDNAIGFLDFVIETVRTTQLGGKMAGEIEAIRRRARRPATTERFGGEDIHA